MRRIAHAENTATGCGGEYTLCGIALDAFESGDIGEPVFAANDGEIVTCPDCRKLIDFCKRFKRYRVPE